MFDENRRRYPRANYPCQLTVWISDDITETMMANTSNIGVGGVCVFLHRDLIERAKVHIQLYFPEVTTPFKCSGHVLRCAPDGDKFYKIAIEFDPLNELQQAFMESKVSELLELEKGKT
jgi:hypothetical protein